MIPLFYFNMIIQNVHAIEHKKKYYLKIAFHLYVTVSSRYLNDKNTKNHMGRYIYM